ncbi:ornithine carbamoyltransferase [Prauserella cavernicola]|uniref:Ornithine carbamoyltransferase n=1 Tax=Prauserella cavernicola TaxID=2800127 RepID=A0A934V6U2_9PSEU|nr:ornithine carbamoyltransferase [Prauserella cavernicola]MBK1787887.1 ornithine carbamoyltransferase [Prauserella cavernicola]
MSDIRHLISLNDLTDDELERIVWRGVSFGEASAPQSDVLRDRIIGIYFSKTSTRTRTAFTVAALRLGARVITYGPGDLQLNTGETIEDTAHVLAGMLDGLVMRTAGPTHEFRALAGHSMPVVNAMSAEEHPTQALADLTTLAARFGRITGLRVLYVGEGNNSAAALARALPRFRDVELEFRTPPGYGLDPDVLAEAELTAKRCGSTVRERSDLADLPDGLDVVYTTRWNTTGTSKADPDWRTTFAPFQVDDSLMARHPGAVFMHDLPAHRGEEVTAEVLDGPASIAFDQARHKLHSAMAVLEWCQRAVPS